MKYEGVGRIGINTKKKGGGLMTSAFVCLYAS